MMLTSAVDNIFISRVTEHSLPHSAVSYGARQNKVPRSGASGRGSVLTGYRDVNLRPHRLETSPHRLETSPQFCRDADLHVVSIVGSCVLLRSSVPDFGYTHPQTGATAYIPLAGRCTLAFLHPTEGRSCGGEMGESRLGR